MVGGARAPLHSSVWEMSKPCEQRILKAVQSGTKTLSLDNCRLQCLPQALGRLGRLTSLSAKNNVLESLPEELAKLSALCYLNLGCNQLKDCSLTYLQALGLLSTLHLFSNHLQTFPVELCTSLGQLRVLNLNQNCLSSIPPEIGTLQTLEQLNLSNNLLNQVPEELGQLEQLQELYLDGNALTTFPHSLGELLNLRKLLLHKNMLRALPNIIGNCRRLAVLDISCNKLQVLPPRLGELRLTEFYYENNPMLPFIPVSAQQQEEVLQLKELVSRHIIKDMKNNATLMWQLDHNHPHLKYVLSNAGYCAMCDEPFLYSWLQCIQFKPVKKVLPLLMCTPSTTHLPIKAALCSYKCFNSEGHDFYGIAV